MTTRSALVAALTPLLPKKWKIVGSRRAVDNLASVVVLIKQQQIIRTPEAPAGARTFEFIATVVDPLLDATRGEDALDDDVDKLLGAIDSLKEAITWTLAKRVSWSEQYPNAYDITLTVTKPKE